MQSLRRQCPIAHTIGATCRMSDGRSTSFLRRISDWSTWKWQVISCDPSVTTDSFRSNAITNARLMQTTPSPRRLTPGIAMTNLCCSTASQAQIPSQPRSPGQSTLLLPTRSLQPASTVPASSRKSLAKVSMIPASTAKTCTLCTERCSTFSPLNWTTPKSGTELPTT